MNKRIQHKMVVIWAFLFVLAMGHPVFAQKTDSSPYRILAPTDFPPFSFVDETGELKGFSVDLIEEIFEQLKIPYTIKAYPWDEMVSRLKKKEADMGLLLYKDNDFAEWATFSLPYYFAHFTLATSDLGDLKMDYLNLKEDTLVVLNNSWSTYWNKKKNFTSYLKEVKSYAEALNLLQTGGNYFFMAPDAKLNYYIKKAQYKKIQVKPLDEIPSSSYSFVYTSVRSYDLLQQIDKTIMKLKTEGQFAKIYNKWLVLYEQEYATVIDHYLWSLVFFVLILVLFFYFFINYSIKRSISKSSHLNERLSMALESMKLYVWKYDILTKKIIPLYDQMFPEGMKKDMFVLKNVIPSERKRMSNFINRINACKVIQNQKEEFSFYKDEKKTEIIVLFFNVRVIRKKNKIYAIIGLTKDITEERKNASIRNEYQKAKHIKEAKKKFIADMNHEIRTPLNSILGFSQLAVETEDHDERRKYGEMIKTHSLLFSQLLNDIYDLSQIEAGFVKWESKSFSLNGLVEELENEYKKRVKEEVQLLIDCSPSRLVLNSDEDKIRQIFVKLLNNAVKFTNTGHIMFGYHFYNDSLYVFVTDTGIGINEKKKARIFERFEKIDNFSQGTGLGLSIVKALADLCGGEVEVSSVDGKGSRFMFKIPYKEIS
ncbi:MAG: transporter substrate-binding domain-containing protein [Massilibacteroides sp.]|nr:transporter substrate-binding domain-containing protein [Massilibacteroides sp.]